jgi:hypothetical protein
MTEIEEFVKKIKLLKCRSFFPRYCNIRYTSGIVRKLAGKNAKGNPGKFSDEQKRKIVEGVEKYLQELKDLIK